MPSIRKKLLSPLSIRGPKRRTYLFQPFFSPEKEAGAIAGAKISCPFAYHPLEENNPATLLDMVITFVKKLIHSFKHPLRGIAIRLHFLHKGTALQLVPVIESGLNLIPRYDPDDIARF
jgi:hypothetical protein